MKRILVILTVIFAASLMIGSVSAEGIFDIFSSSSNSGNNESNFIVGFNPEFPPFTYKDDGGNFTGFDLELAQEVAKRTGLELVTARNVTSEELNKLYNEALCLLYPSDYEGFGLPVLEAQKAGCPVLAQNNSSIPEIIGEEGLMIQHDTPERMAAEMADIVRQLLSRPTDKIIAAGIENAKRFSWDQSYQQVKKAYEK